MQIINSHPTIGAVSGKSIIDICKASFDGITKQQPFRQSRTSQDGQGATSRQNPGRLLPGGGDNWDITIQHLQTQLAEMTHILIDNRLMKSAQAVDADPSEDRTKEPNPPPRAGRNRRQRRSCVNLDSQSDRNGLAKNIYATKVHTVRRKVGSEIPHRSCQADDGALESLGRTNVPSVFIEPRLQRPKRLLVCKGVLLYKWLMFGAILMDKWLVVAAKRLIPHSEKDGGNSDLVQDLASYASFMAMDRVWNLDRSRTRIEPGLVLTTQFWFGPQRLTVRFWFPILWNNYYRFSFWFCKEPVQSGQCTPLAGTVKERLAAWQCSSGEMAVGDGDGDGDGSGGCRV
ncbi:hypothetical protein Acr_03g0019540 [Actinidia rufa]|uniref:Uncharacterized protein n=1 Tax=Actinidia rufa TaxID=165716 RepID=A0A7J0EFM0_9ERIC|nr:hypothetical protein Acr_03g0019540 [Actinidia rufa]